MEDEKLSESILKALPGMACLVNLENRVVWWSDNMARLFDVRRDDQGLVIASSLNLDEDTPLQHKAIKETLSTGHSAVELRTRHKDGSVHWYSIATARVEIDGGLHVLATGVDITERKKTDQRLLEEKELKETIIDAVPGVFYMIDQRARVVWRNRLMDEVIEPKYDEAGTTDVFNAVFEEDRAAAAQQLQKALIEGSSTMELRLVHSDSSVRNYYLQAGRVEIGGEPFVVGTGIDITERKLAEQKLLEEKKLSETIINSLPGPFAMIDRRGKIVWRNEYANQFSWAEPDGNGGVDGLSCAIEDDLPVAQLALARVLAGEQFSAEVRLRLLNGEVRAYSLAVALAEIGGEPFAVVAGVDMTEHRRAEEAVRQSEQRLRLQAEQTSLGAMEFDTSFRVARWNPAAEAIFGYSADEAVGRSASLIVPPSQKQHVGRVWHELLSGTGGTRSTNENVTKDGRVILCEWFNTALTTADGTVIGVASLVDDVTETRRTEDEKRAFHRDVIRSVTEGRLDLVTPDDASAYIESAQMCAQVSNPEDASEARRAAGEFLESHGLCGDDLLLFTTGVGEAITNAIKHAECGLVSAGADSERTWVAVSDNGPGIDTLTLPSATLRRGFSTKVSLGMGYSIMLDVSDRVLLSTGREGTRVVLIKNIAGSRPDLSLVDFPDIADSG